MWIEIFSFFLERFAQPRLPVATVPGAWKRPPPPLCVKLCVPGPQPAPEAPWRRCYLGGSERAEASVRLWAAGEQDSLLPVGKSFSVGEFTSHLDTWVALQECQKTKTVVFHQLKSPETLRPSHSGVRSTRGVSPRLPGRHGDCLTTPA